ncbi:MAG: protein O-mannosyl-transferase family [Phycisphaerae bacterium]
MLKVGNNLKASYIYIAVFIIAAGLYVATCAPGALWQDSGMYQYRIRHNDIEGKLGLALSHPLYHIIGIGVKHIRLGEFAYRINLISAIAAAFTIANLFLLLRLWLGRILPTVIAAATLALSHTFWRHAVIAETYTLYTALLLAELLMLLQYFKTKRTVFLYLLGLFNGLAIANHMFAVIALVCYLVFLIVLLARRQIRLGQFGIIVVLWIIGAAPYGYLIGKNIIQSGSFTATVASAFFGKSWQGNVLNVSLSAGLIKENLIFLAYNFPTPNVIFFFVGLYGLKKISPAHSFANILLVLLILFFVFAFRYTVPDRYAFFIPFYCLASVPIGVGVNLLIAQYNSKILCLVILILSLLPIPTYIIAPAVAQKQKFDLSTRADVPRRNDYVWFLQPWKAGYSGAEKFAEEVFEKLEPDAVAYADNTMVYPLLYMQEVKGKRADIKIISEYAGSEGVPLLSEKTIEQWLSEGDVYAVSPIAGHKGKGIVWKIVD